ncbi:MAG: arylsulfatase [Lachnospiraceae bacterium]|nr:arylsulfatase [Lachnospiraceae bacterium]
MSRRKFIGTIGRTVKDTVYRYEEISDTPKNAPNVVYILLDDMGFAALGCYGSTIHTPNIDRLAKEGLRYNNFHTTAVCSATRACLLTGANHHKVGIASLVDWKSGCDNGIGHIDPAYGTIAEILREFDYSTFAAGKWHLTDQYNPAGPYDTWPLGKGFERYYGFLNPGCDQYHPYLVQDNTFVAQPKTVKEGYHASEDITDHAIHFIYDQKNSYPQKPFFLYLAYGATHSPHHAPQEYIDRYKGRFDVGWDVIREQWFENQKRIGIIPEEAELTDRAPYVDAWETLSEDQRKVFVKHMEVYAGFLEHTDAQIGRLIYYLESIDQLDNTVIVFLSDNGASAEGGKEGRFISCRGGEITSVTNEVELAIDRLDDLGGEYSHPHYPSGWANVCNTPFQWYKIFAHEGGVKDPLIIRYPGLIKDPGSVRTQYHHVSDLTPTILDILGVKKPQHLKGIAQKPFTGTSLKYTLEDGQAEDRKHVQYYEVLGNRGIYKDGWKAVVNHTFSDSYEDDIWELYHVETDYSEKYDVAEQYPEKLHELQEEFFLEAGRNDVFPMMMGSPHASREKWWRVRGEIVIPEKKVHLKNLFLPYQLTGDAVIPVDGVSYSISMNVIQDQKSQGVLFSKGDRFGGFSFFVQDEKLHFAYNANGVKLFDITSDEKLPDGRVNVKYVFDRRGLDDAEVTLYIDNREAGKGTVDLFYYLATGGITIRANPYTEVIPSYEAPFEYTGKIEDVILHSYASGEKAADYLERLLNEE